MFSNEELVYLELSHFSPRTQRDFKMDRLLEDILDKVVSSIRNNKIRLRLNETIFEKEDYLDKLGELDRIINEFQIKNKKIKNKNWDEQNSNRKIFKILR